MFLMVFDFVYFIHVFVVFFLFLFPFNIFIDVALTCEYGSITAHIQEDR